MRAREANTLPKRSHKVARLSLKLLIQSWITFTVLILCSLVLQHYLSGSLHGISTGPGPDLNWHSCFSPSLPSMTLNAGSHVIMQQVVLGPSTRVPLMQPKGNRSPKRFRWLTQHNQGLLRDEKNTRKNQAGCIESTTGPVPSSCPSIPLPENVPRKAAEDGQCGALHPHRRLGRSQPTLVAIWGINQLRKDLYHSFLLSLLYSA